MPCSWCGDKREKCNKYTGIILLAIRSPPVIIYLFWFSQLLNDRELLFSTPLRGNPKRHWCLFYYLILFL